MKLNLFVVVIVGLQGNGRLRVSVKKMLCASKDLATDEAEEMVTADYPDLTVTERDALEINPIELYESSVARGGEELPELVRLRQWVADLQSGMFVNCVYCGHRYGPKENTPVTQADILKAHVEVCPEHPMARLNRENAELQEAVRQLRLEQDGDNR